jgi:putative ABC transport system permease protein
VAARRVILSLVTKNLRRHPVRTGLVVLGIAVAAALLVDMVMLSGGMDRSFSRMLLSRGFQIRLAPKGTLPFDTEAVIPAITPKLEWLAADPDVATAGPVVAGSVHAPSGDSLVTLVGYGIDPAGQGLYQLERGEDLGIRDTTGVLVSAHVEAALGWRIGDTVTVFGRLDPQTAAAGIVRRLVVRGAVRWLYDSRGQRSVGVNFRVMQRLGWMPDRDAASMVMVKIKDGADVEAASARIAAAHPTVEVNSVAAMVTRFRTRLAYFQQLSLILATISLAVGVLLVGTILTIAVNERRGEIAVLRAIGFRRARIVRMVMTEGAVLTAVGAALGVGLGLVTARYLDAILTSFPGLPAAISFFVPDRNSVLQSMLAVLASGVLAAAYPAWIAARLPVAEALRADAE